MSLANQPLLPVLFCSEKIYQKSVSEKFFPVILSLRAMPFSPSFLGTLVSLTMLSKNV